MYPPLPSEVRNPWFRGLSDPTREPLVHATPARFFVGADDCSMFDVLWSGLQRVDVTFVLIFCLLLVML